MVSYIVDLISRTILILCGRIAENVLHSGHNIINISKITLHIPMIINLDRFSCHDLLRKFKICHIRSSHGAIHSKKAQSGQRYPI